jgi:hypothetical protein
MLLCDVYTSVNKGSTVDILPRTLFCGLENIIFRRVGGWF